MLNIGDFTKLGDPIFAKARPFSGVQRKKTKKPVVRPVATSTLIAGGHSLAGEGRLPGDESYSFSPHCGILIIVLLQHE